MSTEPRHDPVLTPKDRQFPGDSIYTQIASYSNRLTPSPDQEFKRGNEVEYQLVDLSTLDSQRLINSLAEKIYNSIEHPVFSQQSHEMPYPIENFEDLLSKKDATVILAWRKGHPKPVTSNPELVGYIIGYPYQTGEIAKAERLDINGNFGPEPAVGDLVFDTFATSQPGQQIGTSLMHLFISQALAKKPDAKPVNLFTFAVDPESIPPSAQKSAFPYTRQMLKHNPALHFISENHIPNYRGIKAFYMKFSILSPKEQLSNSFPRQ